MEATAPKTPTPEEIEALKEKIKNMSPEELKEFQKKQCIFCQIIQGRVQAKKIYEDEKTLAILDINPANPGHLLLFPKEHYTIMPQLPDEEIAHIFMVAKSLSNAILRVLEAKGTNILVANGPAAGQKAQHFMVHIIPRKENDKIEFTLPQTQIPEKDLDLVKEKLSEKMSWKEKVEEKKSIIPEFKKPQQKVLEAQFKEVKEEKERKEIKKKKPTKKSIKRKTKENSINLDDITKMFV